MAVFLIAGTPRDENTAGVRIRSESEVDAVRRSEWNEDEGTARAIPVGSPLKTAVYGGFFNSGHPAR